MTSRPKAEASASRSNTRQSTPPPHKGVSLMSTARVRKVLSNSTYGVYIGNLDLPSASLFHLGGSKGDFLISTHSHDELILRGVFQISRSDCFLSPDGAYQPNNRFRSKFEDVKLSCKLTVPYHDDFQFMAKDFDTIIKNIRGFEALFKRSNDDTTLSCLQTSGGCGTVKMVHPLFRKKEYPQTDTEAKLDATDQSNEEHKSDEADELGDDYDIMNWPVSLRCRNSLNELIAADSHNINPLPAYDIDHTRLPPSKYMEKLPGAIALVSMAFTHYHVKASKRHIFNAICRELVILREADELPSSPYKKRKFARKPLLDSDDELDTHTAASSSPPQA